MVTPPRARPDRLREDRRQARRHDHRAARAGSRRPRRLLRAADAVHPVAQRVRDERLLQDPGRPDRRHGRVHQQVGHRRDPRRRPARGDAPDRGDASTSSRPSSGMDPLELRRKNFIPPEDFPAEIAIGIVYDSGDYHGSLDKLLEHVDLDGVPRASRSELRERGHLPRHRLLHLHGDLRPGAVARRRARAASACRAASGSPAIVRVHASGLGHASTPAPRRTARATRPASPRSSPTGSGIDPSRSRSSTATPAPARWASAPTARARWPSAARRSRGRPRRWPTRPSGSSPTSSRRRPRTSSSPTASSRSGARPTRD